MIAFLETVIMLVLLAPVLPLFFFLAWLFPSRDVLDGLG